MYRRLRDILEMIRFSHTLFALPFALLAAVMAYTAPTPNDAPIRFGFRQVLGILLCMICARSAAMAFNRLVDRHIDAENPRTSGRHLPSGKLSVASVTLFTVAMSLGFWASTLLFLPNWLPPALAMPVLFVLFAYSYTKRFTSLAHFWLGASLMLAPICTWIAIRGEFVLAAPSDLTPSLLVGAAVLLWVAGFDIIYACQDVDFDVSRSLRSVPSRLGVVGALRLAALCHAGMILALAALPLLCPQLGLGIIYWCGIGAVSILLLYEHWLVRPDDLTRVNIAFFHVNTIVSIGLFVVGSVDLLW